MKVWLDCEFTSLDEPELLSVGLVAEDGRECYVELLDAELQRRSSEFVHEMVLPHFGRLPDARVANYQALSDQVAAFLLGINEPVELLYDCVFDRELVQHSLVRSPHWRDLESRIAWRNLAVETGSDAAKDAMEAVFNAAESIGLGRHHALVDARALRLAHLIDGTP